MKGDEKAAERIKIKLRAKVARRAIRYQRFGTNGTAARDAMLGVLQSRIRAGPPKDPSRCPEVV